MARGLESKQQKEIDLDLSGLNEFQKEKVKREIGDYLVNEITRHLSSGRTPVEDGIYKQTLSKDYAKKEKQGNRTANLQLEGDLLSSLDFKTEPGRDSVIVGVMDESQILKAQGHNQFQGRKPGKLPMRRFIPSSNQTFKRSIMDEINKIIRSEKDKIPKPLVRQEESVTPEITLSKSILERLESSRPEIRDVAIDRLVKELLNDN